MNANSDDRDEIRANFLICTICDRTAPVGALVVHEHEYETDEGDLLVVVDYHCPHCRAKLASWGTS